MAEYISIYCTFGIEEEARSVAHTLVARSLAACVNIVPGVKSVYRWNGEVEESDECSFFAKTRKSLFDKAKNLILDMHSYEVPCILALDVTAGDEKFLKWIDKETNTGT